MKVKDTRFIVSAYSYKDYPHHSFPEIAFSGKSNVGKSSLINTLVGIKKLAKISSTPGRTQSINFFNINDKLCFVDLPGYGFARVPQEIKDEWGELINDYLYHRENLKAIIQIVDARHKPTKDDEMMVDWLQKTGLATLLVATKVDKISRGKRKKQQQLIQETLNWHNTDRFVFFSSNTGEGKGKVTNFIQDITRKEA